MTLCLNFADFEQVKKISSYFADFEQVKNISSYFADFEQPWLLRPVKVSTNSELLHVTYQMPCLPLNWKRNGSLVQ